MAELPRYRPLGAAIPSMPSVDLTVAGRAQAGVFREVSRGLDVMSQYLTKTAEFAALAEGQRYGAENAPTQAQLDEAKKEGADISAMLPGDDYTVFGRSARKTSLDVITDQSEMAARQALTALRLEADQTDMPAAELSAKINGLISGYASNLSQLNPAVGSKFQAAMSTVGNTALLSHSQSLAKKAEKQQEVVALGAIDSIINDTLPDIIRAGSTINQQTGELVSIQQKIELERDRIFKFSYAIGDKALANQQIKIFDEAVLKAKVGAVTDFVAEDPMKNFNALRLGKTVSDPHIQDVINNLDETERRAALKAARDQISSELSLDASIESANERKRTQGAEALLPSIQDAIQAGNTPEVDRLIGVMELLDPKLAYSTGNAIYSEGGVDDPQIVDGLRMRQARGDLTINDVNEARSAGGLGRTTYNDFLSKVGAQNDADHKDAMTIVKNTLNPMPSIMPGKAEKQANIKIGNIETRLIKAQRKAKKQGIEFDPFDFVEKELKSIGDTKYSTEDVSDAKAKVAELRIKLGLDATASTTALRSKMMMAIEGGDKGLFTDSAKYNDALDVLEATQ
jgi:uncharacterized protein (DUF2267 family)